MTKHVAILVLVFVTAIVGRVFAHSEDFALTLDAEARLKTISKPVSLTEQELRTVKVIVGAATMRPDTVRFGEIGASQRTDDPLIHVCGYIDGADSDGRMIGHRPFYVSLFEGSASLDNVEIASPDLAIEHSKCGGASIPTVDCAFQSVERIVSEIERVPSRNTALPHEIERFCRALNIVIAPPHL